MAVIGENVNIDVLVSSIGNLNDRVNVTLFDEKNKLIGSKLINVSGGEANELVRFQINPNIIGENNFLVKCSALSDEINIQNNQQKINIHVMKDQYNIALVTGAPNYNTRVIKKYLKNNGNNNIDHFLINKNNFNQEIKEFLKKKYEVIIFDNNPVFSTSDKWESIARIFAKKIISHNSNFFIVPGPEVHIGSLNKYLSIIDLEAKGIESTYSGSSQWKFLDNWYLLSSINEKNNSIGNFDAFPPQRPAFSFINKNGNIEKIAFADYFNAEGKNPLLILGEKQSIRYAIWNSIDFASLQYMLSGSDLDFLFTHTTKKLLIG